MFNNSLVEFPSYSTVQMVSICFPIDDTIGSTINLGLNFYDESMSDLEATWPIALAVLFMALVSSLLLMCFVQQCGSCLVIFIIVLYFCLLIAFGVVCF